MKVWTWLNWFGEGSIVMLLWWTFELCTMNQLPKWRKPLHHGDGRVLSFIILCVQWNWLSVSLTHYNHCLMSDGFARSVRSSGSQAPSFQGSSNLSKRNWGFVIYKSDLKSDLISSEIASESSFICLLLVYFRQFPEYISWLKLMY
jgi:hypothetical protein